MFFILILCQNCLWEEGHTFTKMWPSVTSCSFCVYREAILVRDPWFLSRNWKILVEASLPYLRQTHIAKYNCFDVKTETWIVSVLYNIN